MRKLVLATLAVLLLGSSARAALFLHVPDVLLTQSASPQSGSFTVYLEETAGTEAVAQAYNVGIKQSSALATFTGAGMAVAPHPALFTGQTPDVPSQPSGYVAGRDLFVTDSSPQSGTPTNQAVVNGSRDGLFLINYTVPANALGTVTMNVDPVLFGLFDAAGNDVPVTIDNGSFTVAPAPEPATLGLALLGLPLILRRRR